MLWKSGWRGRWLISGGGSSAQAFSNFPQQHVDGTTQFYRSQSFTPPMSFPSGQFYVGAMIHLPQDLPNVPVGICGVTGNGPPGFGWAVDMDINYDLGMSFYDDNGVYHRVSGLCTPGYTYALLGQVFIGGGNDIRIGAWINGQFIGEEGSAPGARYAVPSAGQNSLCIGQTQFFGASFATAGRLRICGIVGGEIVAQIPQDTVNAWNNALRNQNRISLLSAHGGGATDEDIYTAADFPLGIAPNPYSYVGSSEQLFYANAEFPPPTFDVVQFQPNWG